MSCAGFCDACLSWANCTEGRKWIRAEVLYQETKSEIDRTNDEKDKKNE